MSEISHSDALELVKLRMAEDGVSWSVAVREYQQLTGESLRGCFYVVQELKQYAESLP